MLLGAILTYLVEKTSKISKESDLSFYFFRSYFECAKMLIGVIATDLVEKTSKISNMISEATFSDRILNATWGYSNI
jgi:hypothetical protein